MASCIDGSVGSCARSDALTSCGAGLSSWQRGAKSYEHRLARAPFGCTTPVKLATKQRTTQRSQLLQLTEASTSKQTASDLPLPEGDLGLPLIGETFGALLNGNNFGIERVQKYGRIWKTNILGNNTVMVYDEADVKQVLAGEGKFVQLTWPETTERLVGRLSLNLLQGDQHVRVKRLLNVAFDAEALQNYVPVLQQTTQDWCESWCDKETIRTLDEAKLLAFASLSQTFLGFPADRDTVSRNVALMDTLSAGFQTLPLQFPGSPFVAALSARQELVKQLLAVTARLDGAASAQQDFVPGLVRASRAVDKDGYQLTAQEVEDNMLAALFGNNSAGPTLTKAVQYIHGPVQERLRAEQDAVVQLYGPALSLAALDDMPLTNAVVQELLRITPAVPVVFRKALVDFDLGGYLIPKGWSVWCHLGDAVLKYNDDEFQPERWMGADSAAVRPSSCPFMMPFGSGSRVCLGRPFVTLQLKVFVSVLARSYEWRCAEQQEEWVLVPVPQPKQGLKASFRRKP